VAYYLGIDGGGTKTTCAIGDETSVLATAVAGGSNITRVGEAGAHESLHEAVHQACALAGIKPSQLRRACVGAAGAGRKEVAEVIHNIVAEVISCEIQVVGDMPIALEAAFGTGPGVVTSAGTGSFAYGRNSAGTTVRAGGWGFAISDEGSAHWIGRAAVRELLREKDKDTETPLLEKLMQAGGANSFDDFIREANANMDFAAFFPVIATSAEAGDAVAEKVLAKAGVELARLAAIVIARLFENGSSSISIPLATVGGVFRYARTVRDVFYNEIRKLHSAVDLHKQVVEPVLGALQMARRGTK
jgi:glucosamine kinase